MEDKREAKRTVNPLEDDALEEADEKHREAANARVHQIEHVDAALCSAVQCMFFVQ